jgi:hypothetical protein
MAHNLVLVRAGRGSLHSSWIDRGRPRDWDIRLVPYQEVAPPQDGEYTVGEVVPGPKWAGIREALKAWDGWRDYEYVWMPDDDIFASHDTVTRLFEVARRTKLDLFAPALHDASYFAHFITMQSRGFFGRWTGFVEIMVPGFSRAALERLLPTLDESETGWGWGLDSVWPKLLDYRNVGIIDAVAVTHTRPVGEMRDLDLRRRVHEESDRLLARYECQQEHVTFGAFGPDGAPVDLEPERLLAQLVEGYWPLIERDPRVLSWISDLQLTHFLRPEYPTAGTPSEPVSRPTAGRGQTPVGAV